MRSARRIAEYFYLALLILTATFAVHFTAHADSVTAPNTKKIQTKSNSSQFRTQADCYACVENLDENGGKNSSSSDLDDIEAELASMFSPTSELNLSIKSMGFDKSCHYFSSNRELGKWGRYVLELMDPVDHANLLNGTPDLEQNCPRYRNMNMEQRKHVWVLILSAMSYLESSCNMVPAQGPNGIAFGLLQLHLNKESKYSSSCRNGDSKNPQKTFRCGLGMLDNQLSRDRELFSNTSYWDVLRKNGTGKYKVIQSAVRNYQLCNSAEPKAKRSTAKIVGQGNSGQL